MHYCFGISSKDSENREKEAQEKLDEITKRQMDQVDVSNKRQEGLEELLGGFSTFMQNNQATALATAEKEKKEKAEKEEKDKEEKEKK